MAKIPHEALHQIFRDQPELFTHAMRRVLGEQYPEVSDVSAVNCDLTKIEAIERRIDTILKVTTPDGDHLLAVESQTTEDQDKVRSWAYYLSLLESRHKLSRRSSWF